MRVSRKSQRPSNRGPPPPRADSRAAARRIRYGRAPGAPGSAGRRKLYHRPSTRTKLRLANNESRALTLRGAQHGNGYGVLKFLVTCSKWDVFCDRMRRKPGSKLSLSPRTYVKTHLSTRKQDCSALNEAVGVAIPPW